jgi:hypothetical protein
MGTNQSGPHYLRWHYPDLIDVVLAKVGPREFLWLSFWLHRSLRNRRFSKELARHILATTVGRHHIHVIQGARTFRELAAEMQWRENGFSWVFSRCRAYIASSDSHAEPASSPLLSAALTKSHPRRCPRLKTCKSPKHQLEIVCLLRAGISLSRTPVPREDFENWSIARRGREHRTKQGKR